MQWRPTENLEAWIERVRIYELGIAYQRIANGEDPAWVIQGMSIRIMDKVLHPIIKKLQE